MFSQANCLAVYKQSRCKIFHLYYIFFVSQKLKQICMFNKKKHPVQYQTYK